MVHAVDLSEKRPCCNEQNILLGFVAKADYDGDGQTTLREFVQLLKEVFLTWILFDGIAQLIRLFGVKVCHVPHTQNV